MTDEEIYEMCKTKNGCLEYLRENRKGMEHFYPWSYLPKEKVPILDELIKTGLVEQRINPIAKHNEFKVVDEPTR